MEIVLSRTGWHGKKDFARVKVLYPDGKWKFGLDRVVMWKDELRVVIAKNLLVENLLIKRGLVVGLAVVGLVV